MCVCALLLAISKSNGNNKNNNKEMEAAQCAANSCEEACRAENFKRQTELTTRGQHRQLTTDCDASCDADCDCDCDSDCEGSANVILVESFAIYFYCSSLIESVEATKSLPNRTHTQRERARSSQSKCKMHKIKIKKMKTK